MAEGMHKGVSMSLFIAGILVSVLASSLIASAISMQYAHGPKGDTGPQGPAGSQGEQGPPGVYPGGFITVAAVEFESYYGDNGANASRITAGHGSRYAQVHLPHAATIRNVTAYIYDNHTDFNGVLELWCYNLATDSMVGPLARMETSVLGASPQLQTLYNGTIAFSEVNNQSCIYVLKYFSAPGTDWVSLAGVVIGYEYQP